MYCCTKCSDTHSADQFTSRATEFSDSLSRLSISSLLGSDVACLIHVDADLHVPTDGNFSYLSTHDFQRNHDIAECFSNGQAFSVIHCNIRSLAASYDNLAHMLSEPSQHSRTIFYLLHNRHLKVIHWQHPQHYHHHLKLIHCQHTQHHNCHLKLIHCQHTQHHNCHLKENHQCRRNIVIIPRSYTTYTAITFYTFITSASSSCHNFTSTYSTSVSTGIFYKPGFNQY